MNFKLQINGKQRSVDVESDTPLLWVLRDVLDLTGTKYGCGIAQCGACTVLVDGRATRACVMSVEAAANVDITTIEGISTHSIGRQLQDAWLERDVPQCGYCQGGQILSAMSLLSSNPQPDDVAIDVAMRGNLCRCGTYLRIRAAIKDVAEGLATEPGQ
jgi:isoquinoline 1-oxidoreductase alpha subunit